MSAEREGTNKGGSKFRRDEVEERMWRSGMTRVGAEDVYKER